MRQPFVVFPDDAVGPCELIAFGECDFGMVQEQSGPGESAVAVSSVEGISRRLHYFDPGTESVIEKSEMAISVSTSEIVADGADTAILSGIPVSAEVVWPDGVITSGDSTIEFDTDLPGPHVFRFRGVEYLDKEVTIEAVAAA